jgi:hypothetical protein
MDSYTSNSLMPVPVKYDSLVSYLGANGDGPAVVNLAYYKLFYNGPDYVYPIVSQNDDSLMTVTQMLGSGEFTRFMHDYKVPKVLDPDSVINDSSYFAIVLSQNPSIVKGDTIGFICYSFTTEQYEFLKEFDNNTTSNNNFYDELRVPANLPTNIEPSDKAAGYFFIYSISEISKVFNE